MVRGTLHMLEGGIKYLEIIVLDFINASEGKGEKWRKSVFLDILL